MSMRTELRILRYLMRGKKDSGTNSVVQNFQSYPAGRVNRRPSQVCRKYIPQSVFASGFVGGKIADSTQDSALINTAKFVNEMRWQLGGRNQTLTYLLHS